MQHINLYLPEFRPKLDLLGAKYLAIAGGLMIVALFIYQILLSQRSAAISQEEAAVIQDVKTLETKLERLKNLPKASDKGKMEERLALTQIAIHNREYAQSIIQSKNLGNDKGFSPALTAIASLSLTDIMLSEFALINGGRQVELTGVSQKREAVPQYLQKLQADNAFAGSEFGLLNMNKGALPGQVNFHVGMPKDERAGDSEIQKALNTQ